MLRDKNHINLFDQPTPLLLFWRVMAKIVLITNKPLQETPKDPVWQLYWQYKKLGNETIVFLVENLFDLFRLPFLRADIFDFHTKKFIFLFALTRLLNPNSITVWSISPENFKHTLATRVAVKFFDRVIASSRDIQYEVYQRYKVLPSYIPNGVILAHKSPKQGKKNLNHIAVLCEQSKFKKTLRFFKNKRIKFCFIDREKIESEETLTTMKNSAGLLILDNNLKTDDLRKLALYGLPIITLESETIHDAIRGEAITIDKATPKQITEAIKLLSKNYPHHKKLASSLQKYVTNLFNWEVIARHYLSSYKNKDKEFIPLDSVSKPEVAQ